MKYSYRAAASLAMAIVALSGAPCDHPRSARLPADFSELRLPWPESTPSAEGLDPGPLREMVAWMEGSGLAFRSVVVVKNGKLAFSRSFEPFEPWYPMKVFSCTKSFLSSLVGIALAEGLFPSLDTKVADYLGDYDFGPPSDSRRRVTFEHLLTQSSGFPQVWSWDYSRVVDTVPYVTRNALVAEPGSSFLYNSGTLNVLSAALAKATGMKASDYARKRLFDPLGIRDWAWPSDGAGVTTGGTDLCVSAFDLAKLGYLYLRGGDWFGTRVLGADWVAAATKSRFKPTGMNRAEDCGYGYLWWVDEWGGYSAHGAGGQFCFVLPSLDMVVVFTSSLSDQDFPVPYDLMKAYLIPAAIHSDAEASSVSAKGMSTMSVKVSGVRYGCEKNPFGIAAFTVDFGSGGDAWLHIEKEGEFEEPMDFPVGAGATFVFTTDAETAIAARASWEGPDTWRLVILDMSEAIEFTMDFDVDGGGAFVRAHCPGYGADSRWRASRKN